MAYGIVRLTLYALLAAIESDLRHTIETNLLIGRGAKDLLSGAAYERARERMERDRGFGTETDSGIIGYLDFAESIEVLSSQKKHLQGPIQKAVRVLAQSASIISPIRNRVMHSRPLEYDDFGQITTLCKRLLSFPSYLFQRLRETEEFIKNDPRYVFSLNLEDIEPPATKASHNLPIPDFDETGFLGRDQEATELLRVCKASPWPIITVLGEGGVGKTALALKVAYELLDDEKAGFDAVVWTSSKTTRLTVLDIQNIDGAIRSSVGIFQDISESLIDVTAPIDEILDYLNSFKILLILDNLETILDERVRAFLARITSESKVLITSRVGLGELEYRFPLRAMKDEEAVSLLRATAQVRRVPELTRTNNTALKTYCRKMKNNPLFIKWFVSCVQSGRRPEEALINSAILLDYCLSNVVDYLSDDARFLAKAMVGVPSPHAQPVLAYLTEFDGDRLQLALQQLITTNIAILGTQPTAGGYESLYDLGDLPRLYLLKSHPPLPAEIAKFGARRSELARAHEQIKAQAVASPYSPNTVAIRTRDDVVVAKYLTEALHAVRQKRFEDANGSIEKAKKIAPAYPEVYRVEGWTQYFLRNFAAARQAYETAIELDPQSAVLRYWYAGFLLRGHEDAEGAAGQLRIAHEVDPKAREIRVEYARALSYLFRFDDADEQLRPVIEDAIGATKLMRVAYDGWMQIAVRRGNFFINNSDYLAALNAYEEAVCRFNGIPGQFLDARMYNSIVQCIPQAHRIIVELSHSDASQRAEQHYEALQRIQNLMSDDISRPKAGGSATNLKLGEPGVGYVISLDLYRRFGFIRVEGGGDLYFHQNDLRPPTQFTQLKTGDRVNFIISENQQGFTAAEVAPTEIANLSANGSDGHMLGTIARIAPSFSFGFIRSDDGQEFFFHRSELKTPGQHMSRLSPGIVVRFLPGRNDKGLVALSVEEPLDVFLEDAARAGRRIEGRIAVRNRGSTYAFVHFTGSGDVLVRSEDFRYPSVWDRVEIGDKVSFVVGHGLLKGFVGRDIELEDKFWATPAQSPDERD
jgi:LuxR family glucitol operon transcriptional activator